MIRASLVVPVLAAALFNWGCGGGTASTRDGGNGGSGGTTQDGGTGTGGATGSGGGGAGTGGGAATGGQSGSGGVGTGGQSASGGAATGGRSSSGGAGTGGRGGGNGGNTMTGTCLGDLSCAAGQSCGLDCMGNTGNVSGLAGPGITCSCSNGSYVCRVIYEGTAGSVPPTCPAGSTCSPRCNVCQIPAAGNTKTRTCFCSADLVWICA